MTTKWTAFGLGGALLCLPLAPATLAQTPALDTRASGFSLQESPGALQIRYAGRPLLVYAFAPSQFKPYVRELHTLAGDNVLRDAPPDHQHHHGLMYAVRVNGVNFWEERDSPGYERSIHLQAPTYGKTTTGLPIASFSQVVHWVANTNSAAPDSDAVALLVERRTLTLTVDEANQEVALLWTGEFQAGRGAPRVELAGASYNGLGLRLPESFNRVALHENSERAPYPTEGRGDVTPAHWSAVSGPLGGREPTVALFGRPERGEAPVFFTMTQPFTYLAVTQGLDKRPLEFGAGEKFRVSYLLVAYSDRKTPEFIEKRYQRWSPATP